MNDAAGREPESPFEQTKYIEHVCHNCPLLASAREEVHSIKLLRIIAEQFAPDEHALYTEAMEALFRGLGEETTISSEQIRIFAGQDIAKRLDSFDYEEQYHLTHAEKLLAECEGPIELNTTVRGRVIGVIACGSEAIERSDNKPEFVHITRYEVVGDEQD